MENIINKINKYKSKLYILEQRGGDIIGTGHSGCVLNPPLKCKNDNLENIENIVSKIMTIDDAELEYNQGIFLKQIDPDNQYLIYPIKLCDPDPNIDVSIIKNCYEGYKNHKLTNLKINQTKLLYYKYGGVRYSELKINDPCTDVLDIFESIPHLLEGLNLMHTNDYVHLDIHWKNIIVNKEKSKLNPYFIDFQFSTEIKNFLNILHTNDQLNFLDTIQIYWPLELRLLDKQLIKVTDSNEIDKYINIISTNTVSSKYNWLKGIKNIIMPNISYKVFFNSKKSFLLRDPEQFCKEVLTQVKPMLLSPDIIKWRKSIGNAQETILKKNTPEYELYSELLKKADVYAMGMFLTKIYIFFIGQKEIKYVPEKKPYIILNQKGMMINTNTINSKFLDDLYANLTKPFSLFIGKIINFNFKTRLTSGELLVEYKKLLPNFKKYISDPEFEKLFKLR